jgi:glycosyltransferase involved in cell wall biosynthesis
LHVITGLTPGGAENQLRLLLRHTRHRAGVVTLTNPGSVAAAIAREGTEVHHLGMRSNRDLTGLVRLWRLMSDHPADVVHVHLYRSLVYGRLAAFLARIPNVVSTEHSLGDGYLEGRRTNWANRLLYLGTESFSDVTIAVSQAVRRRLVAWGVPEHKIVVVPNGVDLGAVAFDADHRRAVRESFGVPPDAFVIGTLGRLDPVKRVDVLIDLVAPLLGDDVRLLIVGSGPAYDALVARARAAGVCEQVVFVGERAEVGPMLSAMDLLVAPSASETFGVAVIEALAAGLPVLYSECPALEELPDRGRPQAERVELRGEELRAAIQKARGCGPGRRDPHEGVLERFTIEVSARAVDDVYEKLPRGSNRLR